MDIDSNIDWKPCGELQCATISVPLNPTDPLSRPIKIALNKYTSKRVVNAKTILFGPFAIGGSGTNLLQVIYSPLSKTLDDMFHFVGFDPRGAGDSEKLKCNDLMVNGFSEAIDTYGVDFIPKNADPNYKRHYNSLLKLSANYCSSVQDDLLEFISTPIIARDLDAIRKQLGLEQLNYWGMGYGGTIGATYAHIFPESVGSIILDSFIDPVSHYGKPFE
jgi:pimeloyl-ACP methyl ester carboxylesterase